MSTNGGCITMRHSHTRETTRHASYSETCYRMDVRMSVEQLFDMDIDEWRQWHEAETSMYEQIMDDARRCGCVAVWAPGSRIWHYIHPSLYRDAWQVTTWDEFGPVSHGYATSGHDLEEWIDSDEVYVYERTAA